MTSSVGLAERTVPKRRLLVSTRLRGTTQGGAGKTQEKNLRCPKRGVRFASAGLGTSVRVRYPLLGVLSSRTPKETGGKDELVKGSLVSFLGERCPGDPFQWTFLELDLI